MYDKCTKHALNSQICGGKEKGEERRGERSDQLDWNDCGPPRGKGREREERKKGKAVMNSVTPFHLPPLSAVLGPCCRESRDAARYPQQAVSKGCVSISHRFYQSSCTRPTDRQCLPVVLAWSFFLKETFLSFYKEIFNTAVANSRAAVSKGRPWK